MEYMGQSKVTGFEKKLYSQQSVLNKILAPDVYNYVDSKYVSLHHAKTNSRSIDGLQIPPFLY